MPFWEDTEPRLSPSGTQVAYAEDGDVHLVPAAGGPAAPAARGRQPGLGRRPRAAWSPSSGATTSLAPRRAPTSPTPGRAGSRPRHGDLEQHGDEWGAAVSPDGTEVAYVFTPRADLNRSEIRVADLATGAVRALTGTPRMQDRAPAWSPDGATLAYVSERSGWWALHTVGRDGTGERQLTGDEADYGEPAWDPAGGRIAATRGVRNHFGLAVVDAATGAFEQLAPGGVYGAPQWTASGGDRRHLRGRRHAAGAAPRRARRRAPRPCSPPPRSRSAARRTSAPRRSPTARATGS